MEGFDLNKLITDTANFFTDETKPDKVVKRPQTRTGADQEVAKLLMQERKRYNKLKEELVTKEKELAEANV